MGCIFIQEYTFTAIQYAEDVNNGGSEHEGVDQRRKTFVLAPSRRGSSFSALGRHLYGWRRPGTFRIDGMRGSKEALLAVFWIFCQFAVSSVIQLW